MYNDDSIRYTKKAGLLVAVPLYEALVLPFYSEQATPKSTPNMHTHACTYKYTRQESHILRTSIAAMPWNKIEFTRFRKAKNKVRMTPFFIKCRKP